MGIVEFVQVFWFPLLFIAALPLFVWMRLQVIRQQQEQEYASELYDTYSEPFGTASEIVPAARNSAPVPKAQSVPQQLDTSILPHNEWWPLAQAAHHLMVVGETQEGKSTTTIALLREKAQKGKIMIIDPHEKLNDWGTPTINTGRDWANIDQLMLALDTELSRRYLRGEEIGAPLCIIMDEVPAIMDECDNAPKAMMRLAREGAKVGMNLVILTQDANVESLKIKGQGAVRNNFSKILLGSFAIQVYKDLEGTQWPAVLEYRGKKMRVSRSRLPAIAKSDIGKVDLWQPPGEVLEQVRWTNEHIIVASLLANDPMISQAEIARTLWGGTGGGRRNEQAKELIEDVRRFLAQRETVAHDV